MEANRTKVVISAAEGRIEFEGSEEFVERQLTEFGDLIKQSLQRAAKATPKASGTEKQDEKPGQASLAAFENVFAESDGKIQVLKDIPGSSAAQKMVNAARLLALGNALTGKPTTTFQEIRELCTAHGCLDGKNFSSTIKEEKSDFVFGGGPKSQTVTLSVPGRKVAEKLASDLNATT